MRRCRPVHVGSAALLCGIPFLNTGCGGGAPSPTVGPPPGDEFTTAGPGAHTPAISRTTTTTTTTTSTTTDAGCSPEQAHCATCSGGECLTCDDGYTRETSIVPTGSCVASCLSDGWRASEPPPKPSSPEEHNGIAWPETCTDKQQTSFFGIGDWGGDQRDGHTWTNPGKAERRGGYVRGPDDYGQRYVARQMKALAADVDPDFVINAGDNFYPGGLNTPCGAQLGGNTDPTGQFADFESVYSGPGLSGKPWLSVLGNHDYGGMSFHQGWDVQVMRTWDSDSWMMPGQFWSQRRQYRDFAIQFIFLDTNFLDAFPPGTEHYHNICQDSSGCHNIPSVNQCPSVFQTLMRSGMDMMRSVLEASDAEWHIVVTHFPGPSVCGHPGMADIHAQYGIDLVFTGHQHSQVVGQDHGINYIISGGGGGVTSDAHPETHGRDDAYGFVHFEVNRTHLTYNMNTWGGCTSCDGSEGPVPQITRSSTTIASHRSSPRVTTAPPVQVV